MSKEGHQHVKPCLGKIRKLIKPFQKLKGHFKIRWEIVMDETNHPKHHSTVSQTNT